MARWRSTEVLAWTEGDGIGAPPKARGGWLWLSTAIALGLAFSVIFFTDALCPDHRMWVETLAMVALITTVVTITGLLRGWASAPLFGIASAALGLVIGTIDAVHAPVRGSVIAIGFGVALALATILTFGQLPLIRWDRKVRRSVSGAPLPPVRAVEPADADEVVSLSSE